MKKWLIPIVLVVLLSASRASAQTPVNPTQATFDYDATDFANIDGFEYGYFTSLTATTPVQVSAVVPKTSGCAVNGAVQSCAEALASRPNTFGTWYLGVRAAAAAVRSPWSALVPFDRVPVAPVNVKAK